MDRIGVGWYHILVLVVGGFGLLADGAEMTVLSLIIYVLEDEWGLNTIELGVLTGGIFLGVGLGYLCAGYFTKKYGRLGLLKVSFGFIFCFGVTSGFMWDF